MCKSLKDYINALGYWGFVVIAPITLDVIGSCQLALGNQFTGIPSWVWFNIAFISLLIIPFIAFHKMRIRLQQVTQDKADELARLILQVRNTAGDIVFTYRKTNQQNKEFIKGFDKYKDAINSLQTESEIVGGKVKEIIGSNYLTFVMFHVTRLCGGIGVVITPHEETKRKIEIDEFRFVGSMADRADKVIQGIRKELTR